MLRLPAKRNCAVEESGSGPRKRSPPVEVLEAYQYHRLRRVSIFDGLVSGVPVQDFNTDCGSPQFAVQSGGGWWPRPKKKRDLSTVAAIRRKTSCATRRFWGVWNGRKKAVGGGLLTRPELTPEHLLKLISGGAQGLVDGTHRVPLKRKVVVVEGAIWCDCCVLAPKLASFFSWV